MQLFTIELVIKNKVKNITKFYPKTHNHNRCFTCGRLRKSGKNNRLGIKNEKTGRYSYPFNHNWEKHQCQQCHYLGLNRKNKKMKTSTKKV